MNAQPYQSIFGNEKTEFSVFIPFHAIKGTMKSDFDPELGYGYTEHIFFNRKNDTIFNDQTYKIGDIYGTFKADEYAYVREDTLTGKIYTYYPRCNEEWLVCDLSLNIGDTFYFHICEGDGIVYNDGYIIADSVLIIEGKKIIYFEDIAGYLPDKIFFMEGIGSIFGPLKHKHIYQGYLGMTKLLCVHKDKELVYIRNPESSYGCDYNNMGSGIDEKNNNNLHAYPNPTKDKLFIKNHEFTINHIQIIDLLGRLLMDIIPQNESEIVLDMKSLPSGLYFVKASINGSVVMEKVIKQ
jgi:hypothetical protein